jgi:hypothetical protein
MNYFFDTFLAPQRKVTRPPGRIPGAVQRVERLSAKATRDTGDEGASH